MSFRYRYKGDTARSVPSLGLDNLQPGDTFDSADELNHPDFELVKDTPAKAAASDKAAAKENS